MVKKSHRILAINPGSTSTKIGIFDNEECIFKTTIVHSSDDLKGFKDIPSQKEYRFNLILKSLKENNFDIKDIDAFVGRGGGLVSCEGGTYTINDKLYEHASTCFTIKHPATLGATLACELGKKYNKPSFTVNPPDVDEFKLEARITGLPEIYRESRIHALNQKEIALRYAKSIKKNYKDLNLIVCHLGGGISIAAHNHGKMIDSNDNVNGDGPMAPTRCGYVPAKQLIDLCFSGKYTQKELSAFTTKTGGFVAWLGTDDLREIRKMIDAGDTKAKTIYNAFVYEIAKQIGAMYAALKCNCSAIVLTGGLSNDKKFTADIKKYVGKITKFVVMPGEFELEALAEGALRVLNGIEKPKIYTGIPIFEKLEDR